MISLFLSYAAFPLPDFMRQSITTKAVKYS